MQVEELDEVVSVRADFSGGEITPRAFKRNGKTYRVSAVNTRWVDREGGHPRNGLARQASYHFSVQAGADTCFLSFHTGDMLWRLEQVILPG